MRFFHHAEDKKQLLGTADEALYEAKYNGKNQVRIFLDQNDRRKNRKLKNKPKTKHHEQQNFGSKTAEKKAG